MFSTGINAKTRLMHGLVIGLVAAALSLTLWGTGWFDNLEARTWDWRVAYFAAPGPATDDILIIKLDQESLNWGQEVNGLPWPWPRQVYGAMIDFLNRSGARAVGLDVLYTEPSAHGVEDDKLLQQACRRFGKITSATALGTHSGNRTVWPDTYPRLNIGSDILAPAELGSYPKATLPIPEIAMGSKIIANVHQNPDTDGVYRRTKLLSAFAETPVPILGIGTYLAGQATPEFKRINKTLYLDNHPFPLSQ